MLGLVVILIYLNMHSNILIISTHHRVRLVTLNMLKPSSIYLTDRSRAVLFCGSFLLFLCFVFALLYSIVCSLQPCDRLLGKGLTSWLSCVCVLFVSFVTFPYGVPGQVRYFIVSIPDLCLLHYFDSLLNLRRSTPKKQ